jgi:PLP dependent protein
MSDVALRLAAIESRVAAACTRVGRARSTVILVAVSKRQPLELIQAAFAVGHRHFGENYATELRDKHAMLPDVEWHAIGPVQEKNAKYIAKAAHWYHAVDNLDVARELSRRRASLALPPLRCLVEVNLAGESSKAGLAPDAVPAMVSMVRELPSLELVGLTGMPPLVETPEENRPHFTRLAGLAQQLGLPHCSMGTTGDFEVAIECGATLVRVGTAIFGERPT